MPSMKLAPKGYLCLKKLPDFSSMKTAAGFVCLFAVSSDSLKDSKGARESDPVHPVGCEQDQAEGKVLYQNSLRQR